MKVTGILSIRDGAGLLYPYPVVLHSLQRLCDDVLVGVDPNFPLDRKTIESFELDGVEIVDAPWDTTNRSGGTEIALQMDKLVDRAKDQGSDWVIVMQADELFHDDDFPMLSAFMERNLHTSVTGFSTERIYFWKDLETIRADWNANLVRIFRPGTYSFLAEGTSKDGMFSGPTEEGEEVALPYKIFHYSRVDSNPMYISRRIRNLDGFFHPEDSLIAPDELPAYDFTPRTHDNFVRVVLPQQVEGEFEDFTGTHPSGVVAWYG